MPAIDADLHQVESALAGIGNDLDAIAGFEAIIQQFRHDRYLSIQKLVINSLVEKAREFQDKQREESLRAFDQIVELYGTGEAIAVQELVADALNEKSVMWNNGNHDHEIDAYSQIVTLCLLRMAWITFGTAKAFRKWSLLSRKSPHRDARFAAPPPRLKKLHQFRNSLRTLMILNIQ